MANNYPIRHNGYIYSKGTKAGFLRMKRHGIPRPMFSIENKLAAILYTRYKMLARKLMKDLKAQLSFNNIVLDSAPEDDSLESLLKFFDEMQKEYQKESDRIIARVNLNTVANTLEHEWLEEETTEETEYFIKKIDDVLKLEQTDYMERLYEDADDRIKELFSDFAIDKKKFFEENLEAVRRLYLENSIERIAGEENYIKKAILRRIKDYALGNSPTLKLDDLTKLAYVRGEHMARLFARDQMQRFNKACTLATFKSAAVTKVKWMTCGDVRVRSTHKALNNKVFDINDLPPEVDDYNCRCGLIPVEWSDD